LFEHWADYRHGKISRSALLRRMGPVRRKVERLLLRGMQNGSREVRGTCRELYEHRQWLWVFLRHEGVEPTNNAGERSLRHAVIWRKLSFGTQSAAGSRFVETMLTVIETCRQQRRNVFAFVAAAVEAQLAHQPPPSLLPRV
jgi:transposase